MGAGVSMRYVAGFPMNSGVYIGDVESYYTIDLSAGYDFTDRPQAALVADGPKIFWTKCTGNLWEHRTLAVCRCCA